MKALIAKALWSLLLAAPDELVDFAETVFHPGAGVWMHYSCANGELGFRESEDE